MNVMLFVAAVAELVWTDVSGKVSMEQRGLERRDDAQVLRVSRAEILGKACLQLEIFPDFGRAQQGEPGYWFSPYGYYDLSLVGQWRTKHAAA